MSSWDPGGVGRGTGKVHMLVRFIRVEHTFLSLPMAYTGAFVAVLGVPPVAVLVLVFFALFFLRVSGMTIDNIVDMGADAANPRTRNRPLVTGAMSMKEARLLMASGLLGFFVSAYLINPWALAFSPLVAFFVITYPYVKKYTSAGAFHIAAIEALSVFSGAVASAGLAAGTLYEVAYRIPWLFVAATLLWAVGFDLYNHIQDMEFDRSMGLKNLTLLLGGGALRFAGMNQVASVALAFLADYAYDLGPLSYGATVAHGMVMALAYRAAQKGDYGVAFNYNIYSSVVLGVGIVVDVVLGRPFA
ncbi:MAG: UbiA family prenyltransferase [Nitrososphaerota archaeon]|nr:UbiA family prenyltransferase [Nitrososphaerota archaeon]MDG6939759.1 UbiA family prenyltransferase [Nitrososphaerota archaeon]